jgi:UDP-glucose 4-epimerase
MRTLVTGAAGFIGSTLVDRLLAEGHQVVGVDNFSTGVAANLDAATGLNAAGNSRLTVVNVDVQAPELTDVVAGANPDVIFHLAAHVDLRSSVGDPEFDARANILGTINLCEASRRVGVKRIVYAASGGSRYGSPAHLPVNETAPVGPLSPHAVAKLAGELYLGAYAEMYGMAPICLALANVYGPRQSPRGEAGVISIFGSGLITGRPVTIYGDGTSTRDYVYVGDVVDAFVCAAEAPLSVVGTYNVGTGKQTTVADVYRMVALVLDETAPPEYGSARTGDLHAIALDARRSEADLGWRPAVNLFEGIQRTVAWLRAVLDPHPVSSESRGRTTALADENACHA